MRSLRSRLAFALVFVAAVSSADAPPDQYDPFAPQDTIITDHWARLDWQRVIDGSKFTQADAATIVCMGARLPTYRELLTIVDEDPHSEWDPEAGAATDRYIDPNAFPATPPGPFWSMSPGSTQGTFKVVDYATGESSDLDANAFAWVRCVTDRVP